MLIAAGLILVLFPAALALVVHDHVVKALTTVGKNGCGTVRTAGLPAGLYWLPNMSGYGLIAMAAAVIVPLLLSLVCILLKKQGESK